MFDEETIARLLVDEACLTELMRNHMAWVSSCLADGKHRSWTPALCALVKASPEAKGEIWMHVLDVPFNEHEEKYRTLRELGRRLYAEKKFPVAVVFSSECWMVEEREGTKAPYCEPRHNPARREGIQISGLTIDRKHSAHTFAPVLRYKKTDNMRMGKFSEIIRPDGLPLLTSFFLGFFERTAALAGIEWPKEP